MPCNSEFFLRLKKTVAISFILSLGVIASGCGSQMVSPVPVALYTGSLEGSVHGGQQPVSGARIYVMQAATSGYGVAAVDIVAPAVANTRGGGRDSIGPYFVTDANGRFSISNGYTCAAKTQIYLLALGGNPGLGAGKTNPALAAAAVLGSCPSLQTFQYAFPVLQINELTTVATAYSLGGFMSSPTQVSSGSSANALAGLGNAFLNAAQLVDIVSGQALDMTPNGRGTVPASKIRTLADIIAPCLNSDGTGAGCQTLFSAATNGGAAPADVLSALLNIVHQPGQNVSTLYSLVATDAPFQPALATAPVDLTLSIGFSSGNASPGVPAIDNAGSVWLPNTLSSALTILQSLGNQTTFYSPLGGQFGNEVVYITPPAVAIDSFGFGWLNSTTSGIVEAYSPTGGAGAGDGGGMQHTDATFGIALDASGDVFITDQTAGLVAVFDNNGNALSGTSGFATGHAWAGVAIDSTGRFFVADPAGNQVAGYTVSGLPATFTGGTSAVLTGGGLSQPNSLAFDSANNVWVTNGNSTLSKFQATSGATLSASGFGGGGLNFNTIAQPVVAIAIDGAGTPWVPNYNGQSISHFSAAGVALSPNTSGFPVNGCAARGLAIDPSGNVWVTCDSSTQPVVEFVGAATPVRTPLTAGAVGILP